MKKYFCTIVSFIFLFILFCNGEKLVAANELSERSYTDIQYYLNQSDYHFCVDSNSRGDRFIVYEYDCSTVIYNALEKEDTFNDILEYFESLDDYNSIVIQLKEGAKINQDISFDFEYPRSVYLYNSNFNFTTSYEGDAYVNGTLVENTSFYRAYNMSIDAGTTVVLHNSNLLVGRLFIDKFSSGNYHSEGSLVTYKSTIKTMSYYVTSEEDGIHVYNSDGIYNEGNFFLAEDGFVKKETQNIYNYVGTKRNSVLHNEGKFYLGLSDLTSSGRIDGDTYNYGITYINSAVGDSCSSCNHTLYNYGEVDYINYNNSGIDKFIHIIDTNYNVENRIIKVLGFDVNAEPLNIYISSKSNFTYDMDAELIETVDGFEFVVIDEVYGTLKHYVHANGIGKISDDSALIWNKSGTNLHYYRIWNVKVTFKMGTATEDVYITNGTYFTKETVPSFILEEHYANKFSMCFNYEEECVELWINEDEFYSRGISTHVTITVVKEYRVYTIKDEYQVVKFVYPEIDGFENVELSESYNYELGLGLVGRGFSLPANYMIKNIPEGYRIDGWSFEGFDGSTIDGGYFRIDSNNCTGFTVYLKYKEVYYLNVDDEGILEYDEVINSSLNSQWPSNRYSVDVGTNPSSLKSYFKEITRRGFRFDYWYFEGNEGPASEDEWNTVYDHDITIKAKFTLLEYNVTYVEYPSELEEIIESTDKTFTVDELINRTFDLVTLPNIDDSLFSGWLILNESGQFLEYTIENLRNSVVLNDITLKPNYLKREYVEIFYELGDSKVNIQFSNTEAHPVENGFVKFIVNSNIEKYEVLNKYSLVNSVTDGYMIDFFYIGKDNNYVENSEDYTKLLYNQTYTYEQLLTLVTDGKLYIYTNFKEISFSNVNVTTAAKEVMYDYDGRYYINTNISLNMARGSRVYVFSQIYSGSPEPYYYSPSLEGEIEYNETQTIYNFNLEIQSKNLGYALARIIVVSVDDEYVISNIGYYESLKEYGYFYEESVSIKVVQRKLTRNDLEKEVYEYNGYARYAGNASRYLTAVESKSVMMATDAGVYDIYYKIASTYVDYVYFDYNLELESDGTLKDTWEIKPMTIELPSNQSRSLDVTYNNANKVLELDMSSDNLFVSLGINHTWFNGVDETQLVANKFILTGKDVGVYTLDLSFKNKNYAWNEENVHLTLTINKAIIPVPGPADVNNYYEETFNNRYQTFNFDFSEYEPFASLNIDHTWFDNITSDQFANNIFHFSEINAGEYNFDLIFVNDNVEWSKPYSLKYKINPYVLKITNTSYVYYYTGEEQTVKFKLSDLVENPPTWVDEIKTDWFTGPQYDNGELVEGDLIELTFKLKDVERINYSFGDFYTDNVVWGTKYSSPMKNFVVEMKKYVLRARDYTASVYFDNSLQKVYFSINDFIYGVSNAPVDILRDSFEGINYDENMDMYYVEVKNVGTYTFNVSLNTDLYLWEEPYVNSPEDTPLITVVVNKSEYSYRQTIFDFSFDDIDRNPNYQFTLEELGIVFTKNYEFNYELTESEREMFYITSSKPLQQGSNYYSAYVDYDYSRYSDQISIDYSDSSNMVINISGDYLYIDDVDVDTFVYDGISRFSVVDDIVNSLSETYELFVTGNIFENIPGKYQTRIQMQNSSYIFIIESGIVGSNEGILHYDDRNIVFNDPNLSWEEETHTLVYDWEVLRAQINVEVDINDNKYYFPEQGLNITVDFPNYFRNKYNYKVLFSLGEYGPFEEEFPYFDLDENLYYKIYYKVEFSDRYGNVCDYLVLDGKLGDVSYFEEGNLQGEPAPLPPGYVLDEPEVDDVPPADDNNNTDDSDNENDNNGNNSDNSGDNGNNTDNGSTDSGSGGMGCSKGKASSNVADLISILSILGIVFIKKKLF